MTILMIKKRLFGRAAVMLAFVMLFSACGSDGDIPKDEDIFAPMVTLSSDESREQPYVIQNNAPSGEYGIADISGYPGVNYQGDDMPPDEMSAPEAAFISGAMPTPEFTYAAEMTYATYTIDIGMLDMAAALSFIDANERSLANIIQRFSYIEPIQLRYIVSGETESSNYLNEDTVYISADSIISRKTNHAWLGFLGLMDIDALKLDFWKEAGLSSIINTHFSDFDAPDKVSRELPPFSAEDVRIFRFDAFGMIPGYLSDEDQQKYYRYAEDFIFYMYSQYGIRILVEYFSENGFCSMHGFSSDKFISYWLELRGSGFGYESIRHDITTRVVTKVANMYLNLYSDILVETSDIRFYFCSGYLSDVEAFEFIDKTIGEYEVVKAYFNGLEHKKSFSATQNQELSSSIFVIDADNKIKVYADRYSEDVWISGVTINAGGITEPGFSLMLPLSYAHIYGYTPSSGEWLERGLREHIRFTYYEDYYRECFDSLSENGGMSVNASIDLALPRAYELYCLKIEGYSPGDDIDFDMLADCMALVTWQDADPYQKMLSSYYTPIDSNAKALSFVRYLVRNHGEETLFKLYDDQVTFDEAYGTDFYEKFIEWEIYLGEEYGWELIPDLPVM